jgi:nucleoside-diphosphate-sugar epimerase
MVAKSYLVTGGTGFLGAALVRRLLKAGHRVRVIDNNSRGSASRLADVARDVDLVEGDIRDAAAVSSAIRGMDGVCHLAFVNGTEFFYSKPDLVLDVGVKGMVNVLDGCMAHGVGELILASSSEVYQTPPSVPTDERVPLSVPDPLNPRYSYGGAKLISELMAINYGRMHFQRVVIFRPHNVYGPEMGWEHVLPQLALRMREAVRSPEDPVPLPIQGTGKESRSFVYIDDFTEGLNLMIERGEHLGIYNIGTDEEVTIESVVHVVAEYFGRRVRVVPGPLQTGGTPRRCPDITRLAALGYKPRVSLREGVPHLVRWYDENAHLAPRKDDSLMRAGT